MNKKKPKKSFLDYIIVKIILYPIAAFAIVSLIGNSLVNGLDPATGIVGLSCIIYLITDILSIRKRQKLKKEAEKIDEIGKF